MCFEKMWAKTFSVIFLLTLIIRIKRICVLGYLFRFQQSSYQTSKVFQKLLFDTIYSKVGITLHENQYGFCRKRSAVLQLLAFLNKVNEYFDDITARELTVLY